MRGQGNGSEIMSKTRCFATSDEHAMRGGMALHSAGYGHGHHAHATHLRADGLRQGHTYVVCSAFFARTIWTCRQSMQAAYRQLNGLLCMTYMFIPP